MSKLNDDFDHILTPEEIKEIIVQAKQAPRDGNGEMELNLASDLGSAICQIGKQLLHEFEKDVWEYVDYPWDYVQEEVIMTLGYRSKLYSPKFRDVAYKIWNDKKREKNVRRLALSVWCSYYQETYDSRVLEILYGVLTRHSMYKLRTEAQIGIFEVCGVYIDFDEMMRISDLSDNNSHEEITAGTDWDRVHELMKKYAPEVELVDAKTLNIPDPEWDWE